MADQAQKTMSLKKACADIILNTTKEAAARVMASERKAVRFQHDLSNTKDESIRMLLRLKKMIDYKKTEAGITSLGQQKRIEQLDAQLNEAECVIIDLREELRKAYDQLEERKNTHMLESNEPPENEHTVHDQLGTCCNGEETVPSGPLLNDLFVDIPNLASMIIGSTEPELYRNGYTHRIRAIERNPLDEKNHSEDQPAQEICTKKELIVNEDEQNSEKCDPSSINVKGTDTENLNGVKDLSIFVNDQPVKDRVLAESNPKLSIFHHDQSIKSATEPEKVNDSLQKDDKVTENNEQSACTLRRSIRKRKVRCWDDISSLFKSRAALSRCKKSEEHQHKSKSMAEVNQVTVPITPSKNAAEETKDDEFILSVVGKYEAAAKEASGVPSSDVIIAADKVPNTDSVQAERTGGSASDIDKNKLLKYTFSRKRKKGLSSKPDNSSSNNQIMDGDGSKLFPS